MSHSGHSGPRPRRGAHRTGHSVSSALLPSLLAVLAVTALITALYVWRGEDSQPDRAVAASTTGRSSPSTEASTPSSSTSTPPTQTASETTSVESTKEKADVPHVGVVVLNQTSRRGLASTVADVLRGKGWTVRGVGNFRGVVPATTVYYPPGEEAAAEAAAEALPTPVRIRPRFGNLSTNRLTVVVTSNYPT